MLKHSIGKSGICIPTVPPSMGMEQLNYFVHKMDIGTIEKMYMTTKKGTSVRTAFVHFKRWNNRPNHKSRALKDKGEVYVFYTFPEYIHVSLLNSIH
jgi:hypothetical protein